MIIPLRAPVVSLLAIYVHVPVSVAISHVVPIDPGGWGDTYWFFILFSAASESTSDRNGISSQPVSSFGASSSDPENTHRPPAYTQASTSQSSVPRWHRRRYRILLRRVRSRLRPSGFVARRSRPGRCDPIRPKRCLERSSVGQVRR